MSAWTPVAVAGVCVQATHCLGRGAPDRAKPGRRICPFLPDVCGRGDVMLCLQAGGRKRRSQAGLKMGFIKLLNRSRLLAAER